MTEDQYRKAQEIEKFVTFLPGSYDKRFSRSMSSIPKDKELTPKQAFWLEQMYHRYRRQIPNHERKCKICAGEIEAVKRNRESYTPQQAELDKLQQWQNSVQEMQQPSEQDKQPKLFE